MKKIGIYKITNPKGKIYIGQSTNIVQRWKSYSWKKKTSKQQTKLHYSFKKYGMENHKFEILKECAKEELNTLEIFYINKYNSINEGLNISRGGYYFWEVNKGKKHTKETKNKMKEWWAKNAHPRSNETIKKISKTKQNNPRNTTPEMIETFRKCSPFKKPILQYDIEGNFLKEFESINEAARKLNIRNDGISVCLREKQKTSAGFIWKYKED